MLGIGCAASAPEYARTLSDRAAACLTRSPQLYAPRSGGAAATTDNTKLRADFEGTLEPRARMRLRHDPALDLVAESLAEGFSDQYKNPSPALIQWLFWRTGSVATYTRHSGGWVRWGRGAQGHKSNSLEVWAAQAAEWVNDTPTGFLSYGLARISAGRMSAEMIVFGRTRLEIEPFAKTYAPGGPITLAFRTRIPHPETRLLIDLGDTVEEQPVPAREDGSFFVSRAAPAKPGRYFIEIQAPAQGTLLMVPIHVGVPEPPAPDDFIQHPPPAPPDAAGWPRWVTARYDAERARLGKPPLRIDPRLEALCAERSARAAGGRLEGADSSAFRARLAAAGFWAKGFDETVTTSDATDGVLMNLLRPSTRKRLLHTSDLAFGAAAAPRPATEKLPARVTLVEATALPLPAPDALK